MYTDIQIHPLASSTQEKRFLLSCHGRYYEAALPLVELLEELQQKPDTDAAVAAFVDKKAGKYTTEQVKQVIDKFLAPSSKPRKPRSAPSSMRRNCFPQRQPTAFQTLSASCSTKPIW